MMAGIVYAAHFVAIHIVFTPRLWSIFFSAVAFAVLGFMLTFREANYADSGGFIALYNCGQILAITAGTYFFHWASKGKTLR